MPRFRDAKRKKKTCVVAGIIAALSFLIITAVDKANNYLR